MRKALLEGDRQVWRGSGACAIRNAAGSASDDVRRPLSLPPLGARSWARPWCTPSEHALGNDQLRDADASTPRLRASLGMTTLPLALPL